MYSVYITRVKNIRPALNADRLNLCEVFGNTTVIDKTVNETDLYVYLPVDGQISVAYGEANNLFRKKDDAGNQIGGFIDPDKRNICAIRLRGNKSDGLVMPLSSLSAFGDISKLKEGDMVQIFNGVEIAKKYIPKRKGGSQSGGNQTKTKIKTKDFPFFVEHIDTPQLRFCMDMFKSGDIICLTEKIHGTSSRNANTLCVSMKRNWFDKIFRRPGREVREYKYVVGTRRTVLENERGGFYGTNKFRIDWANKLEGRLNPGETVFAEIAGFFEPGAPIMSRGSNKKTQDKEFIKRYGDTTTFSYGCNEEQGESRFFIYRMTYTSPEGYVIEYPWDLVKLRAEQMGFEVVPELERFIFSTPENFMSHIEKWIDISSSLDGRHVSEGVVVRVMNAPGFKVAKEKSWNFRVLEGIVKAEAEAPDMEEATDGEV